MRYDFFPDREADMVSFGRNLAAGLQARAGHYGLPAELVAEFAAVQSAFEAAYALAVAPETRTRGAVAAKNEARRAMERCARRIAKGLKSQLAEDDPARVALGLPLRKPRRRRVRPPAVGPVVRVARVDGHELTIELGDAERTGTRARPDDAQGATILYALSEAPPATRFGWSWGMGTSKTRARLRIPGAYEPGTPVWVIAWWNSRRDEASPASAAVRVELGRARPVPGVARLPGAGAGPIEELVERVRGEAA